MALLRAHYSKFFMMSELKPRLTLVIHNQLAANGAEQMQSPKQFTSCGVHCLLALPAER
jgi:hypothetical protein